MMKTAVIGASGYVGRRLLASYRMEHPDCLGTSFSKAAPGLTPFDIRRPDIRALRLEETGHQAVLIASANPNIKYCEDEKSAAFAVNVEGTLELVRQLGRMSMPVIFLSSDYVFDGAQGPHDDTEATAPSTEYGRHKKAAEEEIPRLAGRHLILRLSKIFGLQKGDGTLLDDMARSLAEGRQVQAAADQFFCPTYAEDLVAAIHSVQARQLNGVMNVSSPEIWSRHEIALELAQAMRADAGLVKKISLYDFPSMAGRPLNTSMACSRLMKDTNASFTPLRECIKQAAAHWSRPL